MIAGELVGQSRLQCLVRRALKLQLVVEWISQDASQRRTSVIHPQEGHRQVSRGIHLPAIGEKRNPPGVATRGIDSFEERQNPALGGSRLGDNRESELARLLGQDMGQQTTAIELECDANLSQIGSASCRE